MNGTDEQLSQHIDEVLRIGSLANEGGTPLFIEALKTLFADVNECLTRQVPDDLRQAAKAVAGASGILSQPGSLSPDEEAGFRAALLSLRNAIEDRRAQESAAEQLANDPELVQEFLVEAREHLAGVETGIPDPRTGAGKRRGA